MWIPTHIGIEGNERADAAAKKAMSDQIIDTIQLFSKDDLKREFKYTIANL